GAAVATADHLLQVPLSWAALRANLDDDGHLLVAGHDDQFTWFAQRFNGAGDTDPSYGQGGFVRTGLPNVDGGGDAVVLPDGSVVINNTRIRDSKTDLVLLKLQGGAGLPATVTLNAKGTLIVDGTSG